MRRMIISKSSLLTGRLLKNNLNCISKRGLRNRDNIINWGCGTKYKVKYLPKQFLNSRESVDIASNKLLTLDKLSEYGVNTVPYTTESNIAKALAGRYSIYCRTLLHSSKGKGIVITKDPYKVVECPLYTVGIKGVEYRVHVACNDVIGVSKKIKKSIYANSEIKSHDNGYKLSRRDIDRVHTGIKQLGMDSIKALSLDFGAVDIIWDKDKKLGYVLEVNTAPGLEDGSSILREYIKKFARFYNEG